MWSKFSMFGLVRKPSVSDVQATSGATLPFRTDYGIVKLSMFRKVWGGCSVFEELGVMDAT